MLKLILSLLLSINVIGPQPIQSEQTQNTEEQQVVTTQQTDDVETAEETSAIQQNEISDSDPNIQLAVISDTHVSTKNQDAANKFDAALKDLNSVASEYDVLAVGGDMTDHGLTKEYDLFNTILKENMNQTADTFFVMGNHEWMEKKVNRSSKVTDAQLITRFMEKMNVSGLYYDQWIEGYHFITIAGEKSESTMLATYKNEDDADSAYISDKQFKWLEETLPLHSDNNKPIFVFFHQPITGTVYGSQWGAGLEDQKILALLKKYPQVILFSGHSHYPLNDPSSIIQDGITMVNTSAVAYTYTKGTGKNTTQSQGYLVNVYDNRVEFLAREFSTSTWIKTVTIPISQTNQLK
ncbi:MAG: metallophosphoesterase [Bacillus sp. (in: firmicutes)]